MISRPATMPDDFTLIDELLRRCEQADVIDLDTHRHALREPQTADMFHIWLDEAGQTQGFARLQFSEIDGLIEGRFWYYLHPEAAQGQGVGSSALRWAERETVPQAGQRPRRLFTASREDHPARFGFLEANGFTRVRYFFTMKQPLHEAPPAPEIPSGYTIRSATLEDAEPLTDLHNRAFREHWGSQPLTIEEERAALLDAEHQFATDIVAVAPDGSLASFCEATIQSMKREGVEETVGFIGSLGTHPAHRSRGLGRAAHASGAWDRQILYQR
jgi:mycothiol synthase